MEGGKSKRREECRLLEVAALGTVVLDVGRDNKAVGLLRWARHFLLGPAKAKWKWSV